MTAPTFTRYGGPRNPAWRTPKALFDRLDAEFHFTLDPCTTEPLRADMAYFREVDQGLWLPWSGRVFVNPPYGSELPDWMRKIDLERGRCEVIVALVPSRTDTGWWHEVAMEASEIRFIRGRVVFEGGVYSTQGSNAPFPSSILVYRRTNRDPEIFSVNISRKCGKRLTLP